MNNENSKSFSLLSSVLTFLLCIFFSSIIFFILVFFYQIETYDSGYAAIIFVSINLLVITFVFSLGEIIQRKISHSSYIQLVFITILYSLFQFIHMFSKMSAISFAHYALYHLIVLFMYLVFITPIILIGIHNNVKSIN